MTRGSERAGYSHLNYTILEKIEEELKSLKVKMLLLLTYAWIVIFYHTKFSLISIYFIIYNQID